MQGYVPGPILPPYIVKYCTLQLKQQCIADPLWFACHTHGTITRHDATQNRWKVANGEPLQSNVQWVFAACNTCCQLVHFFIFSHHDIIPWNNYTRHFYRRLLFILLKGGRFVIYNEQWTLSFHQSPTDTRFMTNRLFQAVAWYYFS